MEDRLENPGEAGLLSYFAFDGHLHDGKTLWHYAAADGTFAEDSFLRSLCTPVRWQDLLTWLDPRDTFTGSGAIQINWDLLYAGQVPRRPQVIKAKANQSKRATEKAL